MEVNRYKYSEMIITDYNFLVPLDYENEDGEKISIFAREILRDEYENIFKKENSEGIQIYNELRYKIKNSKLKNHCIDYS